MCLGTFQGKINLQGPVYSSTLQACVNAEIKTDRNEIHLPFNFQKDAASIQMKRLKTLKQIVEFSSCMRIWKMTLLHGLKLKRKYSNISLLMYLTTIISLWLLHRYWNSEFEDHKELEDEEKRCGFNVVCNILGDT